MKLREESIGKKTFSPLLGKMIVVNEQNKELLMMSGLTQFFITDIEMKPLKTFASGSAQDETVSQSKDLAYLLDIVSVQALAGFEGRKAKDVKKDLNLLSIPYHKGATLKELADIVKRHDNLPTSK